MAHIQRSISGSASVWSLTEKNLMQHRETLSSFVDTETEMQCQKSFERLLAAARHKDA